MSKPLCLKVSGLEGNANAVHRRPAFTLAIYLGVGCIEVSARSHIAARRHDDPADFRLLERFSTKCGTDRRLDDQPRPHIQCGPAQVYSLAQLRAMVASVRAINGAAATVLDDAQLKKIQGIQSMGSSLLRTDPDECLSLLHDGSLSDDRIPAAAALIGPPASQSAITASSDDSGLFWQGIYSLEKTRTRCSPSTLTLDGQTAKYELSPVLADLHGQKSTANVQTITDQTGPHYTLSMVAMSGTLFVTGSKKIPATQPTDVEIKELSGYINTVIDGAGKAIPSAPATGVGA
ncbi:hypothetical protein AHiyo8_26240 [Arthrobacter sp. Hiyo8]|nr:hypothetical protein AHiyo8_26240 [Arthrobacter sp. Hiyo8]